MKHPNTTTPVLANKIPALMLTVTLLLNIQVNAQIYTWDGGGADNLWINSTNWLEDPATLAFTSNPSPNTISVIFNSSSTAQLTNRLGTAIRLNSLEFSNLASDVVISNVSTAGPVTSLFFRGTTPTLRIAAGVNNAVTFQSGPVETGDNFTIDHQGGGLLTFNSQLRTTVAGDTGGVTKTGSGTMVLQNNVNNFQGGLFIQGGAVRSSLAQAGTYGYVFGSNSSGNALVTLQGGALELYRSGNSTFSNNVVVQSNSTITSGRNASGAGVTYTFDGTLSVGTQTLTINAANVNSGTAGVEFLGATTLTGNATMLVTNNVGGVTTSLRLGAVNESGGSYGLTKSGNGLLTLTAAGNYTGGTTIEGGTLSVASDSFLGSSGGVTLGAGTWQITGGTAFSSGRAVDVTANSTLEVTNTAGATFSGLFSTTSISNVLTKTGGGAVTLQPGSGQTNQLGALVVNDGSTITLASGTTRLDASAATIAAGPGLQLRSGSLILDGGHLITTNTAYSGFNGTTTLTIRANSSYTSDGLFTLGFGGGGNGTLNLDGGTMTVNGNLRTVAAANTSTLANATMNLDAGLLRLSSFIDVTTAGGATVNFNGATVQARASTTDFANTDYTTYRVKSGGAVFDTDGRNITFGRALQADVGSPGGGLVKNGDGTLTLTAANTFTGATSINAGSLVVNGSSLSATTINSGGTLGGTGSITSVTVGSGGTLSPGNSPGLMTITDTLTLEGGGAITWELADFAGSRGGGWDAIDAFSLDISGLSSSSRFTINILNDGLLLNFNPSNDYSFNFLVASNSISNFDSSLFVLNTLGFAAPAGSSGFSWSITQGQGSLDNTLYLNYVVPEPSTYALLTLAGLGLAGHVVRRRYRPRG
jgi:fibronectin-binding autotransporter adhesin